MFVIFVWLLCCNALIAKLRLLYRFAVEKSIVILTWLQVLQCNSCLEQCNLSAVGKFVFGLLAVGNLLDVGNKFL